MTQEHPACPERSRTAGPERSRGERLDETIDRVAGAMTFVASDPALVARIARRVEADAPQTISWYRLGFAAAGVAAVAVLAVAISTSQRAPADRRVAAVDVPLDSRPAAAARPAPLAAAPIAHASTPPARPRRDRSTPHTPLVPQIAALPSPELLTVDGIVPDPLTVSPVDLAPLDLANLALTATDSPDDPKE